MRLKDLDIPDKSYSREIAETITSEYNQSYSLLLVGKTGGGKSFAAIRIAYNIACEVARIKGGEWRDYFTIDNVAIITLEELKRVLTNMKPFSVNIADDIGVGLNSRKWQSQINIAFNDLFTTWRTENTCFIATVPDSFLLDKVPRSLVSALGEVELNVYKKGITILKLFDVSRKPRQEKTYYMYPYHAGRQYVRLAVQKPPKELIKPYEEKRKEIARLLKEEKLANFGASDTEEGRKNSRKYISYVKEIETRLLGGEEPAEIATALPEVAISYILRTQQGLRKAKVI